MLRTPSRSDICLPPLTCAGTTPARRASGYGDEIPPGSGTAEGPRHSADARDPAAAHWARAFGLRTSTHRLVALYEAAETHQAGAGAAAAGHAADQIAAGEAGFLHAHLSAFQAQALLLAGRVEDALALLPSGTEQPVPLENTIQPCELRRCWVVRQRGGTG